MGENFPEPPLIGNLVELFVLICVIVVIIDAVTDNYELLENNIMHFFLPRNDKRRVNFYREPQSTDSEEKIPFENILSPAECSVSVVIPMNNFKGRIEHYLDVVYYYFYSKIEKNKDFTFEIIVVDNASTDGSDEECLQYARNHKYISLLRINRSSDFGYAITVGILHAAGENIFVYMPDFKCPISIFDDMILRSNEMGDTFLLIGTIPLDEETEKYFNSTLGKFLLWVSNFILESFGVSGFAPLKTHSILISREAAIKLVPCLTEVDEFYEDELSLLAGMWRVPIGAVDSREIQPKNDFDVILYIYSLYRLINMYFEFLFKKRRKIDIRRATFK